MASARKVVPNRENLATVESIDNCRLGDGCSRQIHWKIINKRYRLKKHTYKWCLLVLGGLFMPNGPVPFCSVVTPNMGCIYFLEEIDGHFCKVEFFMYNAFLSDSGQFYLFYLL